MTADLLDPRWDWIAVYTWGNPFPRYLKGACRHTDIVPVEAGGEVVALLCRTCDVQLDMSP